MRKKKIILPDIDEYDFPYKFYKCWWKDIISSENWEDIKTIQKSRPAICITMGWLISGNATTIPKSNILKLKEIKI